MKKTLLLFVSALGVLAGCSPEPQPEAAPDTSKAAAKFEAGGSQRAANAPANPETSASDK